MENLTGEIDRYAAYTHKFLQQYVQLSEQDFNSFLPYLEVRSFPKRVQVVRYGQTDDYLNLVVRGLLRKYVLVGKQEKTLQIAIEGQLVQSEISFHSRVPSTLIVETLEPTTLVSISYDHVQKVLQDIPAAERLGRELMTFMFVKKDGLYFSQLNSNIRQRFLAYLQHNPHLLQRVPQKILAYYLNIKPETFSRLKHLLRQK